MDVDLVLVQIARPPSTVLLHVPLFADGWGRIFVQLRPQLFYAAGFVRDTGPDYGPSRPGRRGGLPPLRLIRFILASSEADCRPFCPLSRVDVEALW